jgi:hypothetical protein
LKLSPQLRWNRANREKREAHVRKALRDGTLKRGRCEVYVSFRVDAHHPDYSQPLVVIWLCRKHHQMPHAEQRRMAA